MAGHGDYQVDIDGTPGEVLRQQGSKFRGDGPHVSEFQARDRFVDGTGNDVEVGCDYAVEFWSITTAPTTGSSDIRTSAPVAERFREAGQRETASVAKVGPQTAASQAVQGIEGVQRLAPDSVDQRVEHGNSRPRRLSVRLPSERRVTGRRTGAAGGAARGETPPAAPSEVSQFHRWPNGATV